MPLLSVSASYPNTSSYSHQQLISPPGAALEPAPQFYGIYNKWPIGLLGGQMSDYMQNDLMDACLNNSSLSSLVAGGGGGCLLPRSADGFVYQVKFKHIARH